MQERFNIAAMKAAEELLKTLNVRVTPQADGSLFAHDPIDLSRKNLTALPDLSMVDAGQDFYCDDNQLTDLAGAPRSAAGGFNCGRNRLVSLKGAPQQCADFDCSNNPLTSLEGGPTQVSHLYADGTLLTSLEHAPETFGEMQTPFGTFHKWSEVPDEIRLSPETRQRLIEEAEAPIRAMEAAVRGATILDATITVGRALKFKR